MPVWHRHPGSSIVYKCGGGSSVSVVCRNCFWSMVSAECAFVEAPVGESTHAGVWGFDQPRRRGSSLVQFGFVQLLFVRLWSGRALMAQWKVKCQRCGPRQMRQACLLLKVHHWVGCFSVPCLWAAFEGVRSGFEFFVHGHIAVFVERPRHVL